MRNRSATAALLLLLTGAMAGCGDAPADFYLHATAVVVKSDARFAHRPEFPARLENVVSIALGYWGGDWRDLAGSTIRLSAGPYVQCGGSDHALGCWDGDVTISTSDPGAGRLTCVEQTVLVHEIGHAVIGDRMHADPRWMELDPVRDALEGRTGYTADGEVACEISVGVWRHPLNVQ